MIDMIMNDFETHIFSDDDILNPTYLKEYLLRKNKIKNNCAICGLNEWQNEPLNLILDFKDKNKYNQNLENIRLLCPNCYSQIGY